MTSKKPLVGGLLNMLIPGLGYVYIKRWWAALGYLILAPLLLFVLLAISSFFNTTDPPWPAFVCPSLVLLIYFFSLFTDGSRAVREYNQRLERVRCPYCKEVIQAGALVCRYCQRDLTELPPGLSMEPAPPPEKSANRRVAAGIVVFLGVLVVAFLALTVLAAAIQPEVLPSQVRELIPGIVVTQVRELIPGIAVTQVRSLPESAEATQPGQATEFLGEEPTFDPAPTAGPELIQAELLDFSSGIACLGTPEAGLTCMDSAGWHMITEVPGAQDGEIGEIGEIYDLAACPDGQLWIAHSRGLLATDGAQWHDYSGMLDFNYPSLVVCNPDGGIWLADYESVSRLQDDRLTRFEATNFGTGESVNQIRDLALGPDGRLWVATAQSVAVYDGQTWDYYELGKGWEEEYSVERLAVDASGAVWAGTSSHGLLNFDGESWTADDRDFLISIQAMTLDAEDQLWVGTYSHGLSRHNGGWQNFKTVNTFLNSNRIKALASDQAGRLWIGTEWGLNVYDGAEWTGYHMSNADLPHEEIQVLAVGGAGPALPEPAPKPNGALQGSFTYQGQPLANAKVEVCVELMGSLFSGATPCTDQPFVARAITDAEGAFLIEDLPAGYYVVTVQDPDRNWKQLTGGLGLVSKKTLVEPGSTKTLEPMDIGSE